MVREPKLAALSRPPMRNRRIQILGTVSGMIETCSRVKNRRRSRKLVTNGDPTDA